MSNQTPTLGISELVEKMPGNLRIALLATGDEIVNGDTLNTNGPKIGQLLLDIGLPVKTQMTVGDAEANLCEAMSYLLSHHDVLITIGGLGPTSDDRTRFALAQTMNVPLEFDKPSWKAIVDRLTQFNLSAPDSNRQQAMFPKTASIFPNPFGTARGCGIQKNGKCVYMLPGPPSECLPMFMDYVLSFLKQNFAQSLFRKSWYLMRMSEGHLAADLDPLLHKHPDVVLGYRIAFPYLEIKLQSYDEAALDKATRAFLPYFQEYVVSTDKKIASTQLLEWLAAHQAVLHIEDDATRGALQGLLLHPTTYAQTDFGKIPDLKQAGERYVKITGLTEHWENTNEKETEIGLTLWYHGKILEKTITLTQRRERMLALATEVICWELLNLLK